MVLLSVAILLNIATDVTAWRSSSTRQTAQWRLGAVSELQQTVEPELRGPLDLWGGEWWRIPVSAMHHGGWLHLIMNGIMIWFLGRMLEVRMRWWRYLLFLLSAMIVPFVAEMLPQHYSVGLSGLAYAMFGVLLYRRKTDRDLAYEITDSLVILMLSWLFICVALTYSKLLNVANIAHFAGFGYGYFVGWTFHGPETRAALRRGLFYSSHLLVVAGMYFLVHPFWVGRYQWYRAFHEPDENRRYELLESAVARDPGLGPPWFHLSSRALLQNDLQTGWATMLRGLKFNRSYSPGVELCRRIWQAFRTKSERRQALETLAAVFPDDQDAWERRLGINRNAIEDDPLSPFDGLLPTDRERNDANQPPPWHLPATIDGSDEVQERDLKAPQIDPDAPDSALEGTRL